MHSKALLALALFCSSMPGGSRAATRAQDASMCFCPAGATLPVRAARHPWQRSGIQGGGPCVNCQAQWDGGPGSRARESVEGWETPSKKGKQEIRLFRNSRGRRWRSASAWAMSTRRGWSGDALDLKDLVGTVFKGGGSGSDRSNAGEEGALGVRNRFAGLHILVFEHTAAFGVGALVLDRPTPMKIKDLGINSEVAPWSAFKSNSLYLGGELSSSSNLMLSDMAPWYWLHNASGLKKGVPLSGGVYMGGDLGHATTLIEAGQARPQDFAFFFRHLSFGPGELEFMVSQGLWEERGEASPKLLSEIWAYKPSEG